MTDALHSDACVPAYPLGRPLDRDRYSMTPAMAAVYRYLVDGRDAAGRLPSLAAVAQRFGFSSRTDAFRVFAQLVERGWLRRDGHGRYAPVEPVMRFPTAPRRDRESRS